MSRADRIIQKQVRKMAKANDQSSFVQEQLQEEQQANDSLVPFIESQRAPLDYMHEGERLTVPCETENGDAMTYHDQYYQITRHKNGLPIEAKRMIDYQFDLSSAANDKADDREPDTLALNPSTAYQEMKDAHEAQHPSEDA